MILCNVYSPPSTYTQTILYIDVSGATLAEISQLANTHQDANLTVMSYFNIDLTKQN